MGFPGAEKEREAGALPGAGGGALEAELGGLGRLREEARELPLTSPLCHLPSSPPSETLAFFQ